MIKTIKISGVTKADLTTSNNRERYAWVKNNTGGNVYASVLDSTCTAGNDNVAEIAAGDVRMIDTLSLGYLWLSGNGAVEIQLSDSVNCPFKLSQKGGDISAEGGVIQLGGLQGGVPFSVVTVRGKNLLPVMTSRTTGGLTYTSGSDGSVTVTGTQTEAKYPTINTNEGILLPKGDYALSGGTDLLPITAYDIEEDTVIARAKSTPSYFTLEEDKYIRIYVYSPATNNGVTMNEVLHPQLEYGDTATEYAPQITGQELTITANDTDYTITPDSNPYTVPTEIYQQDGINTVYVTGEGEPTLSVKGVKTNAAVKRIWDKLNELTTAIIVSNGEI